MIKLRSIKAKKFRSWKNIKLDNLDQMGLTLIKGDNGSGKSEIRHIIEYLIMDKFSENVNSSDIPVDEIPYNSGKNCEIEGVFEIDGTSLIIRKFRNHTKKGNSIEVVYNGDPEVFTYTDRRLTAKKILELFDTDQERLLTSTIFSKRSPSFPESTDAVRKNIISNSILLYKYKERADRAKVKVKELEESKQSVENEIEKLESLINYVGNSVADYDKKLLQFEEDRKAKIKELKDSIKECEIKPIKNIVKEIDKLKEQTFDFDQVAYKKKTGNLIGLQYKLQEIETRKVQKEGIEEQIEDLKEKIKELKSEIKSKHKKIIEIDEITLEKNEELRTELNKKIIELKSEITQIDNTLKKTEKCICPILDEDCDRLSDAGRILAKSKNELKSEFAKVLEKLNSVTQEVDDVESIIDDNNKLEKEIEKLELQLESDQKLLKSLKEKLDSFEIENKNEIEEAIKKLESEIKEVEELYEKDQLLKKQIEEKQQELSNIEAENKSTERELKYLKEELDKKKKEINPYIKNKEEAIKDLENKDKEQEDFNEQLKKLNDDIKYYKFWIKGYGKDIPNIKSEDFVMALEDGTNEILSTISDRMLVEIPTQIESSTSAIQEKIGYKVHHPDKKVDSFFSFSEGQRHRVKVADMFAMNRLISNFNFMILDEILELSLDDEGKTSMIEFLNKEAVNYDFVFVMSHSDSVKESFNNVLDIKMADGESKIIGG